MGHMAIYTCNQEPEDKGANAQGLALGHMETPYDQGPEKGGCTLYYVQKVGF
jgi:hypothetical protein